LLSGSVPTAGRDKVSIDLDRDAVRQMGENRAVQGACSDPVHAVRAKNSGQQFPNGCFGGYSAHSLDMACIEICTGRAVPQTKQNAAQTLVSGVRPSRTAALLTALEET